MPKLKDVTPGTVFGQLTVLGCCFIHNRNYALCLCTCGTIKPMYLYSLGVTASSCGCMTGGRLVHRLPEDRRKDDTQLASTYRAWASLWERVNAARKLARDVIPMPERWKDFNNFKEDVGLCPAGLRFDRIDTRLPYSADNCMWALSRDVSVNSESTVYYYNGSQVVHESYLSQLFGYSSSTLKARRLKGGEVRPGWKILTYDEVVAIRRANR